MKANILTQTWGPETYIEIITVWIPRMEFYLALDLQLERPIDPDGTCHNYIARRDFCKPTP